MEQIGKCKGCNRPSRLDDGVCGGCLGDPKRGRKWANMAHRCRTEPEFALAVYLKIDRQDGREKFTAMFGLPPGAERVFGPAVRLVQ